VKPEERRERVKASHELDALLRDSSIGDDAWVECELHGRKARDPYTGDCVDCAHPRTMCLAHMEPEPCQTCRDYIAAGL
jgi:hypothetical protein